MGKRFVVRSVAVAVAVGGVVACSGAARADVRPDWVGMCHGTSTLSMYQEATAGLHNSPYGSSSVDFYAGKGHYRSIYRSYYNKYGNHWYEVGISSRTQDHCGWMSGAAFGVYN